MGDTGLEPVPPANNTPRSRPRQGRFSKNPVKGGAESDARAAPNPVRDPDLTQVIKAWPNLSDETRRAIVELSGASKRDGSDKG
jgi:hypothetical protein